MRPINFGKCLISSAAKPVISAPNSEKVLLRVSDHPHRSRRVLDARESWKFLLVFLSDSRRTPSLRLLAILAAGHFRTALPRWFFRGGRQDVFLPNANSRRIRFRGAGDLVHRSTADRCRRRKIFGRFLPTEHFTSEKAELGTKTIPKSSKQRLGRLGARYLRARLLRFPYGLVSVYGEEQEIREGVAEHRAIVIKTVEGVHSLR